MKTPPGAHPRAALERVLWPDARRIEPLAFRRAPLLAAALCFSSGVLLAHTWHPVVELLLATLLLVLLTFLGLLHTARAGLIAVAALWIVAGLWCAEIEPVPPAQPEMLTYADGLSRTVRGRIVRIRELPPLDAHDTDTDHTTWNEDAFAPPGTVSLDLALDAIEYLTPDISKMVPITGGVRITLIGEPPALACGDLIEVPLRLKRPERYRDPGAWQYADYLLEQGIGAHASTRTNHLRMLPQTPSSGVHLHCRLYAAQTWASNRILDFAASPANHALVAPMRLTTDDAGMLNAMLFGDRTRLTHTLRLGFERTGSFHLFVVSGMHVALLAGVLFWILRRLRLHRIPATVLTLSLTTAYALLTGFGAPVQRALAMSAVFLLARLLLRDRSVLNALGAAALVVLVGSPRALFEASFQMTFLAIVAIAGIAVPLGEWTILPYARAARHLRERRLDTSLPPHLAQLRVRLRLWGEPLTRIHRRLSLLPAMLFRFALNLAELILIGLVAEMLMVLPMALYFHRATLFALPANILSIPLISLLAPMALVTFLGSLVSPVVALLPGAATALLLHGILAVIGHISTLHTADWRTPGPTMPIALVAVLLWMFCCWAVRRSRRWAFAAAVALPLAAVLILWPEPPQVTPNSLELTAIDIGQGDSLLVVSPTGQTMLVDAGGPTGSFREAAEATSRFDVGDEVVSPYLWSRQIRRLDVLVLSHAHSDHMGGMPAVLRSFHPRELWVSIDPQSTAYNALLAEARELGVTVRHLHARDAIAWGGAQITVLSPAAEYTNTFVPVNNDSLVLRVDYGRASMLLEGDAEAPSERTMLATGLLGPVILLKVGHHGSQTSTTPEFLAQTAPRDAVISAGRDNTFGHPRPEILARLAAAGTRLYRTDEFGLTTFLLSADGSILEITGAADN
ncbi:MAG TPA: ComEC/Rec2 family competence protein [Granulicella sp.]